MKEDAGRGYRQMVASPKPMDIAEKDSILNLLDHEFIVIACGGGGIPVVLDENGDYESVPAVIDKDLDVYKRQGYSQGPPMAVAPINMVRRVVDYAVTAIPREKLSLGIPNYGYDWALPYERGVTRAKTINNHQAVQLAIDFGVDIRFDETAMSPYFRYWQYGVQHEVWFEDVRSIKAKFDLIKEYELSGVGYWQLMSLFRANWLMLNEMFYIEREWPVMERLDGTNGT